MKPCSDEDVFAEACDLPAAERERFLGFDILDCCLLLPVQPAGDITMRKYVGNWTRIFSFALVSHFHQLTDRIQFLAHTGSSDTSPITYRLPNQCAD